MVLDVARHHGRSACVRLRTPGHPARRSALTPSMAGLLAHGSAPLPPSQTPGSSGFMGEARRSQLRGQPRQGGMRPLPRSLSSPSGHHPIQVIRADVVKQSTWLHLRCRNQMVFDFDEVEISPQQRAPWVCGGPSSSTFKPAATQTGLGGRILIARDGVDVEVTGVRRLAFRGLPGPTPATTSRWCQIGRRGTCVRSGHRTSGSGREPTARRHP